MEFVGYISAISAIIGLIFLTLRIGYWVSEIKYKFAASRLTKSKDRSVFTPNYTTDELSEAFRTYVLQDCGQADPSHETDFRHVADIREPVFSALDRFLDHHERRRHILVLADSGMGKTSLCVNYYNYRIKKFKNKDFTALISLSRPNSDRYIDSIENKNSTNLILDALDEDSKALANTEERILELLKSSSDFKSVIITCRSQFFRDVHSIPKDTGVTVISPRKATETRNYILYHLYLMPFSEDQIELYLKKQFPIFQIGNRQRRREARDLIKRVPELSGRPMLLELVPDLIKERTESRELFDLYAYMVENWLNREKGWISSEKLKTVSMELAVEIHTLSTNGKGDRITRERLEEIAHVIDDRKEEWEHLSTRSLLNRDNDGLIKFAHRSVMEYFFVLAAIYGDERCFDLRWTDVMRDLLVSWGYTSDGQAQIANAERILKRDLSKTSLIPLSDPPAMPGFITLSDLTLAAARRTSRSGSRRIVHWNWRSDSTRVDDGNNGLIIQDVECDLEWMLSYSGGDLSADERATFQLPLSKQLNYFYSNISYRAPSYEELVTLIEALESKNMMNRLALNSLYLLGDTAGERSHLVVEIFKDRQFHSNLYCIDGSRHISGTQYKTSVYEISIYKDPAELNTVKVLPLQVRNLSENL